MGNEIKQEQLTRERREALICAQALPSQKDGGHIYCPGFIFNIRYCGGLKFTPICTLHLTKENTRQISSKFCIRNTKSFIKNFYSKVWRVQQYIWLPSQLFFQIKPPISAILPMTDIPIIIRHVDYLYKAIQKNRKIRNPFIMQNNGQIYLFAINPIIAVSVRTDLQHCKNQLAL